MKRLPLLLLLAAFLMPAARLQATPPDEGMWVPLLISQNVEEMKRLGFRLTAEDVYSVNKSSLKDAIVHFGGFCTGEIISSKGLILTNHHCGYDAIAGQSTVQDNILANGFWAKSHAEEKPIAGLFVRFLDRIEDVSKQVKEELEKKSAGKTLSEGERNALIAAITKPIIEKAKDGGKFEANVQNFYFGDEFFLFVYRVYKDVRLVGTPHESIGKFGGDTDNWNWPRHTGDFSLFRVYAKADGTPSEYSADNKPLEPRHHLPVSIKGVELGDFAMIMGYPGRTERFLTSPGVKLAQTESNPFRYEMRTRVLKTMKGDMDDDAAVRIQYASKYSRIANYWKYFYGQTKGLTRLRTADVRAQEEAEFEAWVKQSPERVKKYGNALPEIRKAYDELKPVNLPYHAFVETIQSLELAEAALDFSGYLELLKAATGKFTPDKTKSKEDNEKAKAAFDAGVAEAKKQAEDTRKEMLKTLDERFKNVNAPTEQKLFVAIFDFLRKKLSKAQQPDAIALCDKNFKGDLKAMAADIYSKSILTDKARMKAFLEKPDAKKLESDPGFSAIYSYYNKFLKEIRPSFMGARNKLAEHSRALVQGLREKDPKRVFYPDANSTMRLTYGTVKNYKPMDAVAYSHYTTLEGVYEKEDPNNEEFVVPAKLIELYKKKDYGQYANKNGELPVCFLTNNDITGGNSGSPVINGNGELIGLAFDSNWEGLSGEIDFDEQMKFTINVDIRYVLFVIDKMAGAKNIIDELKLVK